MNSPLFHIIFFPIAALLTLTGCHYVPSTLVKADTGMRLTESKVRDLATRAATDRLKGGNYHIESVSLDREKDDYMWVVRFDETPGIIDGDFRVEISDRTGACEVFSALEYRIGKAEPDARANVTSLGLRP